MFICSWSEYWTSPLFRSPLYLQPRLQFILSLLNRPHHQVCLELWWCWRLLASTTHATSTGWSPASWGSCKDCKLIVYFSFRFLFFFLSLFLQPYKGLTDKNSSYACFFLSLTPANGFRKDCKLKVFYVFLIWVVRSGPPLFWPSRLYCFISIVYI